MATLIDANTSIYKLFNDFLVELALDIDLPAFEFLAVSSLESAYLTLSSSTSKIVVVQKEQSNTGAFTKIVYSLVPSFSGLTGAVDYNSILTLKVFSAFMAKYPRYTAIQLYEAIGLISTPSIITPLDSKMAIIELKQSIVGASTLQNNFTELEITFLGYLS
jgi:hypothetical protein